MSQSQNGFAFNDTLAEDDLTLALAAKSAWVYPVGPAYPLAARHREAIEAAKLDWVIAGKGADGRCETFAQRFERVHGQPWAVKRARRS